MEKLSCKAGIFKIALQCGARDDDVMLNSEPPDEFIEIDISFIVVNLFDCSHYSTDDKAAVADQRRTRFVDWMMFKKDFPPSVDTGTRYTEAFEDYVLVPSKLPKS
jgi:hypothetical protein